NIQILRCLGTKGVKNEKITWVNIYTALSIGFVLFFSEHTIAKAVGRDCHIALHPYNEFGIYSLAHGRDMDEPTTPQQPDGRCFQQRERKFSAGNQVDGKRNSVNLPTKFYYKGKWNNGWINVVNPFRASIVLGTPGSGKSYAIVNNYIKQHIEKPFSMYIYDFKFDDLSTIAYNH